MYIYIVGTPSLCTKEWWIAHWQREWSVIGGLKERACHFFIFCPRALEAEHYQVWARETGFQLVAPSKHDTFWGASASTASCWKPGNKGIRMTSYFFGTRKVDNAGGRRAKTQLGKHMQSTQENTSRLSRSQILVGLFGLFPWCPSLELQESNGVRLQSSIVRNRCMSGHCGWQVAPWHWGLALCFGHQPLQIQKTNQSNKHKNK